jgi:hypothetical protein
MENIGTLAQFSAVNSGGVNLTQARPDGAAMLAPLVPDVPWRRGGFDDFERPVTRGLLPLGVDNATETRGPYDAVCGWRDYSYTRGEPIDGDLPAVWQGASGVNLGGNGSPFGGPQPSNGGLNGGPVPQAVPVSYRPFGPQQWCLRIMGDFTQRLARPNLNRSRFYPWYVSFANAKLHYLWPGDGQRFFARPVWNLAYPAQFPRADQPLPLSETVFFRLNMKSRFPYLGSGAPGTWAFTTRPPNAQESAVEIVRQNGWWLPRRAGANPPAWAMQPTEVGAQSVGANAWIYQYAYQVMEDPEIGITNTGTAQTAYFVQVIAFAAINENRDPPAPLLQAVNGNDDIPVLNPYAGFNRAAADAPAPIDLDHSRVLPTGSTRRDYLTYLGIARQGDATPDWPSKFDGGKPYPNMVAVAQAKVFNDHSWDLWTQMWHAQLEPVSGFDRWITDLNGETVSPVVSPTEVAEMKQYFTSIQPLAAAGVMNH